MLIAQIDRLISALQRKPAPHRPGVAAFASDLGQEYSALAGGAFKLMMDLISKFLRRNDDEVIENAKQRVFAESCARSERRLRPLPLFLAKATGDCGTDYKEMVKYLGNVKKYVVAMWEAPGEEAPIPAGPTVQVIPYPGSMDTIGGLSRTERTPNRRSTGRIGPGAAKTQAAKALVLSSADSAVSLIKAPIGSSSAELASLEPAKRKRKRCMYTCVLHAGILYLTAGSGLQKQQRPTETTPSSPNANRQRRSPVISNSVSDRSFKMASPRPPREMCHRPGSTRRTVPPTASPPDLRSITFSTSFSRN